MIRCNTWRADTFRFSVQGRGAQHFLSAAARQGVRLTSLRCEARGYSGRAAGRDRAALQALAARGGWQFAVLSRRGPGTLLEKALARPGLPLGCVLFLVLLRLLSGFVWAIDFGALDGAQAAALRAVLAQSEVWEGCRLPEEKLALAQRRVSAQSGEFGWISLNFTGGCLFVESTQAQYQPVRREPAAAALVAKAGGQVLEIRVESGFGAVQPGQYVAQGQLLAGAVRADRSGAPVNQAARGGVVARVEKSYTARQPLRQEKSMLTGARAARRTLLLLGRAWGGREPAGQGRLVREWLPLRLGRLALPGCVLRETWWEETTATAQYTAEAAKALARRACRLQLTAEFPDAQIETARYAVAEENGGIRCTASYIFRADIAAEAKEAPPPNAEN